MVNWLVETCSKSEEYKGGWDGYYWIVEVTSKDEVREGMREIVNTSVKSSACLQVSERLGEGVYGFIENST